MSHTSTIDAVIITDVKALEAAIKELNTNGVSCELLRNAKPRAYYSNQENMGVADYVVRLNKSKYDVGLYQREGQKGYEARTDFFAGQVSSQLGVKPADGESTAQAGLGKLYNLYAVHAATRTAVQQGYRVNRKNNTDGSVQLRVQAA